MNQQKRRPGCIHTKHGESMCVAAVLIHQDMIHSVLCKRRPGTKRRNKWGIYTSKWPNQVREHGSRQWSPSGSDADALASGARPKDASAGEEPGDTACWQATFALCGPAGRHAASSPPGAMPLSAMDDKDGTFISYPCTSCAHNQQFFTEWNGIPSCIHVCSLLPIHSIQQEKRKET